ncbi:hypothetical protein QAD02_012893 [Eretmocerus hayati]|uniref:Uncharacterized protein n=1 Tax=Eretmocerus hayati TaxID=131215 RepID=A0ACC2P112_9HYME|nr:hypothetical protein QAD02_012893 [Eretmocerus hayati]
MVECIRSITGGDFVGNYLRKLESDSYRSDSWVQLAKEYMNLPRDHLGDRTAEVRVKLLHWRFKSWGEGVYTQFNMKRNKIDKKSKAKPKVPEEQVLTTNSSMIVQLSHDVDLWIPRNKFPSNFPAIHSSIAGYTVNMLSFESLELNHKVDDAVINAYLRLLCCDARKKVQQKILPFDVHLVLSMIQRGNLKEYKEWVKRVKLDDYKIWLLPICHEEHWTLLVIVPDKKLFIYLDSMHGTMNLTHLQRVCSFLCLYWSLGKRIRFTGWTLFTPSDTPTQYRGEGEQRFLTMNCGPHVITWCHTICSGELRSFNDYSMDSVRRRISEVLLQNNGFHDRSYTDGCKMTLRFKRNQDLVLSLRPLKVMQRSTYPVLGYENTYELCASLHKM